MRDQVDDHGLAGLARSRPVAARPTASVDPAILAPVPAPLDCTFLHLDDDGPACLALPPAVRLSRRQVELVCAVETHAACPRFRKATAGRAVPIVEPPVPAPRRGRDRLTREAADPRGLAGVPGRGDAGPAGASAAVAVAEAPAAAAPAPAAVTPAPVVVGHPSPAAEEAPAHARAPSVAAPASTPSATGLDRSPVATQERVRRGAASRTTRLGSRPAIALRPATAIAWVILGATLILVIVLLTARGGLSLPAAATPSSPVVLASPSPGPTAAAPTTTIAPSPSPTASSAPTASSSPVPTVSPSASPPFPPDRMALLKPCPGIAGCYQYRIKSGDNLHNVATFFGVTYQALLAANPQITNPSVIHVGDVVVIPVPNP